MCFNTIFLRAAYLQIRPNELRVQFARDHEYTPATLLPEETTASIALLIVAPVVQTSSTMQTVRNAPPFQDIAPGGMFLLSPDPSLTCDDLDIAHSRRSRHSDPQMDEIPFAISRDWLKGRELPL